MFQAAVKLLIYDLKLKLEIFYLTLETEEEWTRVSQIERNRIQKELLVPVQTELDGELEDEAADGEQGHGVAVEEDQLDPASLERHRVAEGDITEDPEDEDGKVGLEDHAESQHGKDEGEADGDGL